MKFKTSLNRRVAFFVAAFALQFIALILMASDTEPHGFSIQSLTIAPILLIVGLALPIVGLSTSKPLRIIRAIRNEPLMFAGFLSAFLVSFITYALTLEPTASLWDCSETIASTYKLQVPHTPGIPLTLLIGRLFAMLAFGDVYNVAWFVNLMSAFFSALAVGLSFLVTWYFGQKMLANKWVLFLGSLSGVLCLAFSDSFWFSAVEAETYGPSVFFMVLLIWMSIRGRSLKGEDRKLKILQLAYLVGLSYCIHPMCILILPVCVLIWRFKDQPLSFKQLAISIGIGVGSILFISKVVAVDLFEWAFQLDLLLVNQWSFPFYSGVFALLLIITGGMTFFWLKVDKSRLIVAAIAMVVLGFSPYMMLFIRSSKLPPINEFTPSNLAKIKPYMNRESYPSRPLLYGPYFDAQVEHTSPKASSYIVNDRRYEKVGEISTYHYTKNRLTILPRMYSNDPSHVETYRQWTGLKQGEKPRFSDNLAFMIQYQLGEMYFRYLLWNYAGRAGDVLHAGWLTPWEGMPDRSLVSYSKATNQYFMLPLLLGLLGMIFQYRKDRKGFIANFSFFLITGFLLAVYLNATPNEPRERDYIYVGSYISFAIWIGLGMMYAMEMIESKRSRFVVGLVSVWVPIWILYQNLDDHDRSNRTFQMEHARSILASCEENAILFTGGDNDTFPMWYLQDVEGFRTDVRVKVLSYFNADWYINQLSRQYYNSPPLLLSLKESENQYGPYNPLYIQEQTKAPILWDKYVEALKDQNPQLRLSGIDEEYYYLPSRRIDVSTSKGDLEVNIEGRYLPKSDMAILDIIGSNDWSRPVYFNYTGLNSISIGLRPYLIQEGLVYKLSPDKNETKDIGLDLEKSHENLMHRIDYTNLEDADVYFNHEDYQARMIMPVKFAFNKLIHAYLDEGEAGKARELTQFAHKHLYYDHLESSYADIQLASLMKELGIAKEPSVLVSRTFQFFHEKISRQLNQNGTYSNNDLLILQEATRFLQDPKTLARYQELVNKVKEG